MIELNEGYTKDEGKLIHIQNNKFRYLLRLSDFYNLSTTVLRGWSEFVYNKQKPVSTRPESEFGVRQEVTSKALSIYQKYASSLSSSKIEYRVLDVQDKLLTIVVSEENIESFDLLMKEINAKELSHPFGVDSGYIFLYQMKAFRLFQVEGYYIEVYSQLPCASITPNSWIPVDKIIQKRVWYKFEEKNGLKWCDGVCCYIYHLCWAIFHNKGFSSYEKTVLQSNISLLDDKETIDCFKVIFFNFTEELVQLLKKGDFGSIIPRYFSFIDY